MFLTLKLTRHQGSVLVLLLIHCLTTKAQNDEPISKDLKSALDAAKPAGIKAHMNFLADDLLEGRQPGSKGFNIGALYIKSFFESLGIAPAGENGTYIQSVPMLKGLTNDSKCSLSIIQKDQNTTFQYGEDYYVSPDFAHAESSFSAPVVFVGYGITAPEFNYDNYQKMDVKGKVVLIVNGAPPSFPSNERAFFSSGTTKCMNAIAHGAIGVISFTISKNARYTWESQVRRSRQGIFRWSDSESVVAGSFPELRFTATLSEGAAALFFKSSNKKFEDLISKMDTDSSVASDLKTVIQVTASTQYNALKSFNIIGKIEGSDPELKNEHVVYVAHLDHFGIGVPVNGDSIYNGAHDNASGVSIVLETIKAFKALPHPPSRSIIFLIATGEEYGLQGSDYFVSNPTIPSESMVAALALDMPFFFHPLHDIVAYGVDHSSLGKEVTQAADLMKLTISSDPIPEQVLFIRSDHYSFIKRGIPSLFIKGGFITGDEHKDGRTINLEWRKNIYHSPQDDMNQDFDFNAGADHARLNFLIGYLISNAPDRPTWKKGDFFGSRFSITQKP